MPGNKTKTDRLHKLFPKLYQTTINPNWQALLGAIGESDEETSQLIEAVRKQLFIITSNRPFLDRLGANTSVTRPRFIGMDDPTFRRYIPVLSYQPKQVKFILDLLLDIFFFKESTTSFIESDAYDPFVLEDGFVLEYTVDRTNEEQIVFAADDFVNISAATADEIVAAINRQAEHSFAIVFDDSITKKKHIRLFTDTLGSKGSVEITGGRANIGLQFEGFLGDAGTGLNTEWTSTKVGDLVKFQHTAGDPPGIQLLQAGDIIIIDLVGNAGSFVLEEVDVSNDAVYFRNLFGTAGIFTQTSADDVKFLRPFLAQVHKRDRRAVVWEVASGNITVEMPSSPPVVRRSLAGAAHINGWESLTVDRVSDTELEIEDASDWPDSGQFSLESIQEIQSRILTPSEDNVTTSQFGSRLHGFDPKYTYTSKTGNILQGITPDLPTEASTNQVNIATGERDNNSEVTIDTASPHDFQVGETVIISDTVNTVSGDPAINLDDTLDGSAKISEVVDNLTFKYIQAGDQGQATGGTARVERINVAASGSKVLLRTAQIDTGTLGPYVWDTSAPYVISSLTASLLTEITLGSTARNITVGINEIPDEEGQLLFDFGTERQEGPVRYFYKPTDNSLFIDPSYVFEHDHGPTFSSAVTVLRQKGPHVMSGSGDEYAPYITDTALAREILQDLMQEVKSVGIFMEFLIRFPEQLYGVLNVYRDPNFGEEA